MNTQSELYVCLYAKEFPAQALLRLRPELRNKPYVVMEGEPPLQRVCSLNAKARKLGLGCGMTRVELETFSSVVLLPRSKTEESGAKAALLECAGTFSPRVEDRSNDRIFLCGIDIAGTEKLFGSPSTLAQTLLDRMKSLGIATSVAVSCNLHAAVCLARGMSVPVDVIAPGDERKALTSLSLTVLDLSEEHADTFSSWGIHTLGMLAAIPEVELIARMGQEGKRLRQLAWGKCPHFFVPVIPELQLEETRELEAPVGSLDSLLFVIGAMLEQLIVRATGRMVALASVKISLSLDDKTVHIRTVRSALPTNNRQLWIKLLHLDLEAHPPKAPILSLVLHAEPGSAGKVQLGLFSSQLPDPMRLDVILARIHAIVGERNAGRPVLKNTYQPDAFCVKAFTVPSGTVSSSIPDRLKVAMRQLRPAETVSVTLSGQKPVSFFFRKKRYKVEHAYGPWRSSGNWWNPTLWSHVQWDVVARSHEGMLLYCCLVRDLTQAFWQLVALYD